MKAQAPLHLPESGHPIPDGYDEVFSPVITLKNGKKLFASNYGLKAFRFLVRQR
jgi:hypothetical protein